MNSLLSDASSRTLRVGILSATLGLLLGCGLGAEGIDPRRVSVLYIGDPYPGITPYLGMKEDAFVLVYPIRAYYHGGGAAPLDLVLKYMRTYMPRSYQELSAKHDVVILSDAYRQTFTPAQHFWFRDGVLEEGLGLAMVAGLDSFWASATRPEANWQGSPLEEILPITIPTGRPVIKHNWIRKATMELMYEDHEFIASLPYEPQPRYMAIPVDGQLVYSDPGSEILARWIEPELGNPPLYVTWDLGTGRTFAMMHDWTASGGEGGGYYFSQWEYYRDFAINLVLFLAKRPLHPDHLIVHQYREIVHGASVSRSLLLSLIDFIDKFGGNPRRIDEEMAVLDAIVLKAQGHYLDHDFDKALAGINQALVKSKEIEHLSVRIKNQALFWVYVVEWLSVTGVSLLSGFTVWTLMIRRRLYRDVASTRFDSLR